MYPDHFAGRERRLYLCRQNFRLRRCFEYPVTLWQSRASIAIRSQVEGPRRGELRGLKIAYSCVLFHAYKRSNGTVLDWRSSVYTLQHHEAGPRHCLDSTVQQIRGRRPLCYRPQRFPTRWNRGRFLWCYHIAAPGQSSYPVLMPNHLYSGTLPSAALRSIHGILYNKQLREFCQQINPR